MQEHEYYNLYNAAGAGTQRAKQVAKEMVRLQILHLRHEHGMTIKQIAARMRMRFSQVQEILASEDR